MNAAASDPDVLAEAFKALAHPARLAILRKLAAAGECNCGALVDETSLAQSTVSQHLRVLKDAGLILGRIEGPRSCYCLDREALTRVLAETQSLMTTLSANASKLAGCTRAKTTGRKSKGDSR